MIRLVCDGCHHLLEPAQAVSVGDLDATVFCSDCKATWDSTEATIAAARVAAIQAFSAARSEALTAARAVLQKVPDDPGEGDR